MQLKSYKLTCFLLSILCAQSFATSVVMVVTTNGIVVGADTKVNRLGSTPDTVIKVRLLKKKLIVACLGTEGLKRGSLVVYHFPSWISEIDDRTSAKISVSELASKIKKQVPVTFAALAASIKSGQVTKQTFSAVLLSDHLVDYIVAGYEKGKPVAYRVTTKIDWDSKSIQSPEQIPLEVNEGRYGNFWIDPEGFKAAVSQIDFADSEQNKKFVLRAQREWRDIKARNSLSLNEASNIVRAYLGMEAEGEPKYVGFPITVVTVPAEGDGWTDTYKTDVPSF